MVPSSVSTLLDFVSLGVSFSECFLPVYQGLSQNLARAGEVTCLAIFFLCWVGMPGEPTAGQACWLHCEPLWGPLLVWSSFLNPPPGPVTLPPYPLGFLITVLAESGPWGPCGLDNSLTSPRAS